MSQSWVFSVNHSTLNRGIAGTLEEILGDTVSQIAAAAAGTDTAANFLIDGMSSSNLFI